MRPPFECHAAHGKDRVNDFETAKLWLGVRAYLHHGASAGEGGAPPATRRMSMDGGGSPWPPVPVMALLSFLALSAGVAVGFLLRPM